jgi:tetratricopeptide (TPR) repeat protein
MGEIYRAGIGNAIAQSLDPLTTRPLIRRCSMGRSPLILALALCLSGSAAAADRPWTTASSAHFTVISDDGLKTARDVAWQFEQIRAAIQAYWSWARTDLDRPVFVFAVHDEDRMKSLAPKYWEERGGIRPSSVAVAGADRHYIALRTDLKADDRQGSVNPYLDAYWAYTSVVIGNGFQRQLPLWFSRGLAAFMSNTLVSGSSLQIGRVVPSYLQRLQTHTRPMLHELLTADRNSPWYTNADRLGAFDADAWAFVHYLMLGDNGAHRAQLERFAALVRDGQSAPGAIEGAFGNGAALEAGFNVYYTNRIFQYLIFNVDVNVKRDAFEASVLSPANAAGSLAAWHVAMRRPMEARTAIDNARKADAKLPGAFDAEGILLESEGKSDEARTAYGAAIELQSTNAYVHYRWAALTWGPQTDVATKAAIDRALDRATLLNDRFAPAFTLSAFVKGQLGRAKEALPLAERAVALAPGGSQNHVTLASVLLMLSRRDEARVQASAAFELATTDSERRAAQQIIDAIVRAQGGPAPRQDAR